MSVAKALKVGKLAAQVRPGKQALTARDSERVREVRSQKVIDSLDLDGALKESLPQENRWDYLIGTNLTGREVLAVEVHPAYSSEVRSVIAKKQAAKTQLQGHLQSGAKVQAWLWVSSGPTRLAKTTPEFRLLQRAGIRLVGSALNIS